MRTIGAALAAACVACLALVAPPTAAAEDQAYWALLAETSINRNAGMPDMSAMLQGMDPAMLQQLPPEVRAMMAGGAQRRLNIRLWAPLIAPADATAYVLAPEGLKQGPRLDLGLYRPKPVQGEVEGGEGQPEMPGMPKGEMTIKIYWGSSPTVRPGQPKVHTYRWEEMTPERQEAMRESMAHADDEGGAYFYKAGWTTGYWPAGEQTGMIAPDASLHGTFDLHTTYTGNIAIEVPDGVDFLDGITFSSPDLSAEPDLSQPLVFRWQPIPNVLGYFAQIIGSKDNMKTTIIWTSAEVETEQQPDWDFMQMADVRRMVDEQIMMPGNTTEVTVPAGIFEGCDTVFMTMIGYGTGTALPEGQPLPRVQTKTTFTGMLSGMGAMGAMGGMGGVDEDE